MRFALTKQIPFSVERFGDGSTARMRGNTPVYGSLRKELVMATLKIRRGKWYARVRVWDILPDLCVDYGIVDQNNAYDARKRLDFGAVPDDEQSGETDGLLAGKGPGDLCPDGEAQTQKTVDTVPKTAERSSLRPCFGSRKIPSLCPASIISFSDLPFTLICIIFSFCCYVLIILITDF